MELSCKTTDYSRKTENHAAGNQLLAGSVCKQGGRGVLVGRALKHTLLPKLARKSMPVKVGAFLGVLQGHTSQGPVCSPVQTVKSAHSEGYEDAVGHPVLPHPPSSASLLTPTTLILVHTLHCYES